MRDRYERRHRRIFAHPESVKMMAKADFDAVPSLATAMGLRRCIHGGEFPCPQCRANRAWNEAATGKKLTEAEFEAIYCGDVPDPLDA